MLRFACSQLTVERADPLVTPGQNPAPHTHQIIAGNSFNLTQDGGMTVYYMPYPAKNNKMTAFKPGLRMIAGDPMSKKANRASICHRCLGNGEGFAPCDSKDTAELPTKYCSNGIRATSHVAYSNSGGLGTPNCPSTHPVAISQVMYEIMWDTGRYNNTAYFGDSDADRDEKTGYGQHGDYLFGWKDDSLQKVMDALPSGKCVNANCQVLKIQSAADSKKCKKAQQVVEDIGKSGTEWLEQLPGGVELIH
ncbi:hypothetical protein EK21DRAFT_103838 [Setomelanomma holmii]|uniref:DUF1996 domain-containing protein n=1 Tax=Setomelanomma holmii TaxID=210430 RepID=A0A9P4H1I5_9PLEO|nr:hypothetical protein EK21DRAFT_103838 [Setomelanomma holmii]